MKIISHRGNLNEREPNNENNPNYIDEAINEGFDVEIDLWFKEGSGWLGHDKPEYQINIDWVVSRLHYLWVHAKNTAAVEELPLFKGVRWFWHQEDTVTLTSAGDLWAYPGNFIRSSIVVDHGKPRNIENIRGVCTDNPIAWRKYYEKGR